MTSFKDVIWTYADGRKLRIGDMGTPHIKNTISLLERNATEAINQGIDKAYDMIGSAGDGGIRDALHAGAKTLENMSDKIEAILFRNHEPYRAMVRELIWRGQASETQKNLDDQDREQSIRSDG